MNNLRFAIVIPVAAVSSANFFITRLLIDWLMHHVKAFKQRIFLSSV